MNSFSETLERLLALLREPDKLPIRKPIARPREDHRHPSPPKRTRALALLGLVLMGCGGTFSEANAHNEAHGNATTDDEDDKSPWRPDGPFTSTSGPASGTQGDSASSGETWEFDETSVTSSEGIDEPPVIQHEAVDGSKFPEPITAAGLVTLSVVAHDDHAVDRVEFFVDGVLVAIDTEAENWAYSHTVVIDHQDDAGEHEFYAVAYDNAGQTSVGGTVAWTVVLPESGSALIYEPNEPHPGEHVYWTDVAISATGEFLTVGHREINGTVTLLVERRAPDGELIDPSWIFPTVDRVGVAITLKGTTPIIVARNADGSSWIGRYLADGTLMNEYGQTNVEWRDVTTAGELIYLTGNTGSLVQGNTLARTWALTNELIPYWVRSESEGGSSNVAHALAVDGDTVFATGHITLLDNQRRGAAWAYSAADGTDQWARVFGTADENLFDVSVLDEGLRVAGLLPHDNGTRMHVRLLNAEDGSGVPINGLAHDQPLEAAYTIATSSHDEFVIAGSTCSDGECFAHARRYAGSALKWQQQFGLKSPSSRVVASTPLPFGYTALIGQGDVNYGQGDQGSSWLAVLHP